MHQDVRDACDIDDNWNAGIGCHYILDEFPPLGLAGTDEGGGILV